MLLTVPFHADESLLTPAILQYNMSNWVEDALEQLARKHVTTRFVKLHYQDAEMDEIAAPGILAYRAGECFANLVSFVNEVPAGKDITTVTVESVLQTFVNIERASAKTLS